MGASLDYRTYKIDDRAEVARLFESDANSSRCEDGMCYSGAIGMLPGIDRWAQQTFDNENAAIEYISENHSKWDGAIGARFALRAEPTQAERDKHTKKLNELLMKSNELQFKADKIKQALFDKLVDGKSKLVGCKKCGSKVSRHHLTSTNCPVCKNTLLAVTDNTRWMNAAVKAKKVKDEYHSLYCGGVPTKNKPTGYGYVVGGWCSS